MALLANRLPGLDFDLGEAADMLRSTVEAFAAAEIAPRAAAMDRDNAFPMDLWPKFGELGMLGITVEEEYGGAETRRNRSRIAPPGAWIYLGQVASSAPLIVMAARGATNHVCNAQQERRGWQGQPLP